MSFLETHSPSSFDRPKKRRKYASDAEGDHVTATGELGSGNNFQSCSMQSKIISGNDGNEDLTRDVAISGEGREHTSKAVSREASSDNVEQVDISEEICFSALATSRGKQTNACCIVSSINGLSVGFMNRKTASDFMSCSFLEQLRLEIHVNKSALDGIIAQYEAGTSGVCFVIDINIFGSESLGQTVGEQLSRYRLFLQHPDHLQEGIKYQNPQYLASSGLLLQTDEMSLPGVDISGYADLEDPEDFVFENQLWALMDSLHRPSHLDRVVINTDCITTNLMEHQRDVVDFLLARETESTSSNGTLWKEELDGGRKLFRHAITGSKSPSPIDALGGILADDMGLGKTLSTIASIATSLARARDYVATGRTNVSNRNLIPTPATLVVVPSALILDGWVDEIQKHVAPNKIQWHKYHGLSRSLDLSIIHSYDIVLTTYGTVAADCSRRRGLLDQVFWYRIVLDEGTPIQDSLEDLGALVRFLRLPLLDEPTSFRRYIVSGIKVATQPQETTFNNIKKLLSSICLRRSNKVLQLPGLIYEDCRPEMTRKERKQYNVLVNVCNEAIEQVLYRQTQPKGKTSVLESLLRLRLFCNLGLDCFYSYTDSTESRDELLSLVQQSEDAFCAYCGCDILTLVHEFSSSLAEQAIGSCLTRWQKIVCAECLMRHEAEGVESASHHCNQCISYNEVGCAESLPFPTDDYTDRPYVRWTPSKLLALVGNIQAKLGSEKCLVFSFWRKSLDAIGGILHNNNIRFTQLDGSVSRAQRKGLLKAFETMKILNNLSLASTIHILEPQWNPSIESQAIGRIFRHGQKNQVRVVRYIMKDSIEEGVESRQFRKIEIAHGSGLSTENSESRDPTPAKTKRTYVALKEHLSKYVNSEKYRAGFVEIA
ncbi:DNA repair and recombination protein rad5c [Seiridium cupressi]